MALTTGAKERYSFAIKCSPKLNGVAISHVLSESCLNVEIKKKNATVYLDFMAGIDSTDMLDKAVNEKVEKETDCYLLAFSMRDKETLFDLVPIAEKLKLSKIVMMGLESDVWQNEAELEGCWEEYILKPSKEYVKVSKPRNDFESGTNQKKPDIYGCLKEPPPSPVSLHDIEHILKIIMGIDVLYHPVFPVYEDEVFGDNWRKPLELDENNIRHRYQTVHDRAMKAATIHQSREKKNQEYPKKMFEQMARLAMYAKESKNLLAGSGQERDDAQNNQMIALSRYRLDLRFKGLIEVPNKIFPIHPLHDPHYFIEIADMELKNREKESEMNEMARDDETTNSAL